MTIIRLINYSYEEKMQRLLRLLNRQIEELPEDIINQYQLLYQFPCNN